MVVRCGGTITKGRLINVTRCRVAGSDFLVARAANLHQATDDWMLRNPVLSCSPEFGLSGAHLTADIRRVTLQLHSVSHFVFTAVAYACGG